MAPRLPTNRLTRHLLFWVAAILLAGSTYVLDVISNSGSFSHQFGVFTDLFLARIPTFIFYTYLLTYQVLPLIFRGQYVGFFVGLLVLSLAKWILNDLLSYCLTFPLLHWLHKELPFQQDTWLFGSLFPGTTFWISNVIAGLFIGGKLFLQWQQKQAESQRLEREKLQTELYLLKLQLDPAFLFNILDTLQPLIRQQAKQGPEVILKLAHFLRYILYESQIESVPIAREIGIIDQYIFLQQTLHPSNLDVSFSVRGSIDHQSIAPLTLFPIVENTFRQLYSASVAQGADEPNWMSVDLAVSESLVSLKVVSESTYLTHDEDNRLPDLAGLQKQLTFYYPGRHQLKIWQEDRIKVVTLTIEFPTNSPTSVSEATTDTIA